MEPLRLFHPTQVAFQRVPTVPVIPMKLDKPALAIAAGFFLLWLCVLYAGADHPPPLGFVWLVLLDLIASGLLYLRVRTYADWHAVRRPHRVLLVLRDGALTGLAVGTATLLFSVARLGSVVATGWEPVLIWLIVLALVGTLTSAVVYAVISLAWGRGLSST